MEPGISREQPAATSLPRALRPFRLPAYRRLAVTLPASLLAGGVRSVAVVWEVLIIGLAGHLAVVLAAAFLLGALFSAPNVLWGTVLQRRVPPALLGRIAGPDFLVSITLTPVSMALARPRVGRGGSLRLLRPARLQGTTEPSRDRSIGGR